jgi:hypothetical protein
MPRGDWGDSFANAYTSSLERVSGLIARKNEFDQTLALKNKESQQAIGQFQQNQQIEMMKMGYSPSNISAEAFKQYTSNPNAPKPKPGQYLTVGDKLYRQNPELFANLAALKTSSTTNINIPQSLSTPESKNYTPEQVLSQLSPDTAAVVKGLTDYSLDPTKVTSMRGNQRMEITGLAKRVDPNFNMTLYPARADYMKNVYGGKIYDNTIALNTLASHLDNADQTIENLHAQKLPAANFVMMMYKQLSGDPTPVDYNVAKDVVDNEVQRLLTQAAVTVEGKRMQSAILPSKNASYAQMKQYIKSLAHIADQRGQNMESAFVERMGKHSGGLIINPKSKDIYTRITKSYTKTGKNSQGQRVGMLSDGTIEVIK